MLKSLTTNNDNRSYNFNYLGNTGLLTSRTELNEKITLFNYEKNGKLKERRFRETSQINNRQKPNSYFRRVHETKMVN